MVHEDLAVQLRFADSHLSDVHVSHLSVGPSFGPVDASAVVIVHLGRPIHVGHDEARALRQLAALVGGVNLRLAGAATHPFLAEALPAYGTPHANE